jgi:hypothetical protein
MTNLRNLEPTLWGPSAWSSLHAIAFHSQSSLETLCELFEDMKVLLPCSACRGNYRGHLESLPFPKTRREVPKWLYLIHDRVNRSNGHPPSPSYASVQRTWKDKEGIERAKRDSWRFLFLLAMAYPPRNKEHREFQQHYRSALTRFIQEIGQTLWKTEPRESSVQSRTRFIQWLKNKYAALNGHEVPSALMKIPKVACQDVCKA